MCLLGFFTFEGRSVTPIRAMARVSRKRKQPRKPPERNEILERLKEIATGIGLEVREERLHREVGYSVRSGICKMDGLEIVLLDRNAAPAERIETLCQVLSDRDLDAVWIEPELRSRIGSAVAPEADDSEESLDSAESVELVEAAPEPPEVAGG